MTRSPSSYGSLIPFFVFCAFRVDAYLGATLQSAWVDMVFVQFYNNYCGTQAYGTFNFNFEQWDDWAKTMSLNSHVKIYLGVPASRTAANAGYVTAEKLSEIVDELRCKYNSFGGIMMWDASQAYGNFESGGVEFSIAAARNLKRSKRVVCGGEMSEHVSVTEHHVSEPSTLLATRTTSTVPATPKASATPSSVPVEPPQPIPVPVPQQQGSMCPIEGEECQLPVSSTEVICDGYKFAVCNHGKEWTLL